MVVDAIEVRGDIKTKTESVTAPVVSNCSLEVRIRFTGKQRLSFLKSIAKVLSIRVKGLPKQLLI